MPIAAFFEGLDKDQNSPGFIESQSERDVYSFLQTGEGLELASAFPKVRSPALRRRVVELVRTMADEQKSQ